MQMGNSQNYSILIFYLRASLTNNVLMFLYKNIMKCITLKMTCVKFTLIISKVKCTRKYS